MQKILIVGTHPIFLEALKTTLNKDQDINNRFEILTSSNLDTHLEREKEVASFELIILDYLVQGSNYLSEIEKIKSCIPNIKILVISSIEDRERVKALINIGVDGFINKSFSGESIVSACKAVLTGGMFVRFVEHLSKLKSSDEAINFEAFELLGIEQQKAQEAVNTLTKRELQVLKKVIQAQSNKEISNSFTISVSTVKVHVSSILNKFELPNRLHLIMLKTVLGELFKQ